MTKEELLCRLCRLEAKIEHISKDTYYLPGMDSNLVKLQDEEKRFRTIQRTVSRLQEEIKLKDRSIKKLQSKISELEAASKNSNKDLFTWCWSK